jgi:hypothetical protein
MGSSNYDDFQESIDKLRKIAAEIICLEHYGALTPPEGREFCERAKKEAQDFRREMIDIYKRKEDLALTVEEMAEDFYCGLSEKGLLSEDLLKAVLRRMVKFLNQIE